MTSVQKAVPIIFKRFTSFFCLLQNEISQKLFLQEAQFLQNIHLSKCLLIKYFSTKSLIPNPYTKSLKHQPLAQPPEIVDDFKRKVELFKVLKFLLSKGCTKQDIRTKCAPHIRNNHTLYLKAVLISELHPDIISLLPLLSLSADTLRKASMNAKEDKSFTMTFPNRISFLSHHLEVDVAQLVKLLTKHSSLLTMDFLRLKRKMDILKDARISSKYIAQDLWIFNYNEKLLTDRVSVAMEKGVHLKPWMLRCSEKTFESVLNKSFKTLRILGEDDEISYLAKKLDCSDDYVEFMMEKNKLLKTINIPKIEQILTFLFEKGYTPQEIRLFPRVFCSSPETLNTRFEEFRKISSSLPTMSQLCASSKDFKSKLLKCES